MRVEEYNLRYNDGERMYVRVPYRLKGLAKDNSLWWDKTAQSWYVPDWMPVENAILSVMHVAEALSLEVPDICAGLRHVKKSYLQELKTRFY